MDLKEFKDPGKKYRAAPFWSWNDDLTNEELRWQVKEMKDKGFGGYFMHSRVGLKTPYLSEEWMERIANTLDEGKKQEMETWLYDEDKWPSGAAGGIVTADNEEYRAKYMEKININPSQIDDYLNDKRVKAVFALDLAGNKLKDMYKIESKSDLEDQNNYDLKLYAFKIKTQAPRNWFNGESYADLLNPDAVEKYINITHEKYKEEFAEDFGEYMPGIFTDEPNYVNEGENTRPWTLGFADYFKELHDYDILNKLPLLYYETGDYHKVRYDFFYTITKRFIEAFSKPVYEFCEDNNLELTGHYLEEDTLFRQTNVIGAAMPHYEYMQVPGIDHLGRNIEDPLTLKQCSSAAHQFGRNRILCENFGVSGHSMSFEDQKWIADFHFALGVTYTCQHLVLYSMVGDRKRDYPPTFSYHQPYWEDYKLINDYFARAGWVCSQGDYIADTLVLHPIASVWANFDRDYADNKYDEELTKLQDILLSSQISFDYGDEIIMEDNAAVVEEKGEVYLQIAEKGSYKVVVIPPSLTWSQKTLKLLQKFINKGGKVVFIGETPELIEGENAAEDWEDIKQGDKVYQVNNNFNDITTRMEKILDNEIKVINENNEYIEDIYSHLRKDEDKYLLFLNNISQENNYKAKIKLPFSGNIQEFNLETGDIATVDAEQIAGGMKIKTEFPPVGSHAYLIDTAEKPEKINTESPDKVAEIELSDNWDYSRLNKNSLTLDYCRYSVDDGEWSEEVPIWQIRKKMWYDAGLGEYDGVQPWVIEEKGIEVDKEMNLKMQFTFNSEIDKKDINLVIEKAEDWILKVNNVPVDTETEEYYWDKQFGLIDISEQVVKGENIIELECNYRYGIEVEKIYLVGEFGIKQTGYKDFVLTDVPQKLKNGSWVYQRYPFYAGNMLYKDKVNLEQNEGIKYKLKLNNPQGTLFKIRVNGNQEKFIYSQPWEIDITEDCICGENELEIEVVSSLRNTFGPLHHRLNRQPWTGPEQFEDEDNWVKTYQFEDYGLLDGASIIVEK